MGAAVVAVPFYPTATKDQESWVPLVISAIRLHDEPVVMGRAATRGCKPHGKAKGVEQTPAAVTRKRDPVFVTSKTPKRVAIGVQSFAAIGIRAAEVATTIHAMEVALL